MIGSEPNFASSEYFVDDKDNWHLLDGAPAEIVKEFNEFMNEERLYNHGTLVK